MKNLFISILCITISSVYGGEDCCLTIGSPIPSSKVAFHARLTPHVTLGSTQTVIFDHVLTNICKAYNEHTGYFTAPFNGIYIFACTFLQTGDKSVHLQMVHDSSEISKGHAASSTGAQGGSMNAVVYLHKGDVVKVRHYPGLGSQTIHGCWSFVTGYLV
ncbi:unnamed protein product [Mytilus coruscus]|uniref:C1q domain-containing protein n=1 Tax=Mytilus coruscus TaxID=42192 RepID=A0A6J8A312_MYTCO|nr:unnamed protein product [Mytilus coruscus]